MKLRSRDRCSAMTSEIRWSCSVIKGMLNVSPIHFCRRTAAADIVVFLWIETLEMAPVAGSIKQSNIIL
jgi:hypothetical protein